MRILIVNSERSHASLVGSALKRLGHRSQLCAPEEALTLVANETYEGVIAAVAPPPSELVSRLRAADIPVALAGDVDRDWAANHVTSVLPRVWTVADLKRVVDDFVAEHRRFARGSSPAVEFEIEDDGRLGAPPGPFALPPVPTRNAPINVEIACRSWADVLRLCHEIEAGRTRAIVRGRRELHREQRVLVLLRLPDELVLTVAGHVVSCQREDAGRFAASIDLPGLEAARLRSLIPTA